MRVLSWREKHLDGDASGIAVRLPWRRLPSVPQPAAPRRCGSPKAPGASPYAAAPANQRGGPARPGAGASSASRCRRISPNSAAASAPPPPHAIRHSSEVTGTVHSGGHWDWQRRLRRSSSPRARPISTIAHRHNVPAHEIMRANGLHRLRRSCRPGQRLVIPRYVADGASAKLAHAALPRHPASPVAAASPAPRRATTPGDHIVASGETLIRDCAKASESRSATLAHANNMTP